MYWFLLNSDPIENIWDMLDIRRMDHILFSNIWKQINYTVFDFRFYDIRFSSFTVSKFVELYTLLLYTKFLMLNMYI